MNHRTALLTGAAAIAMTSSAWAAQGDTYISLFGGYSTLSDADILHYRLNTTSQTTSTFVLRRVVANNFTTVTTTTVPRLQSYTVVGTYSRTYILHDSEQFSGSVGSDGWVVGASLGVELFAGLRGEAEVAFRRFDLEDGATLDQASLYRRLRLVDAYYSYVFPLTKPPGSTTAPTQKNFLVTVPKTDFTATRVAYNTGARATGELTSFSLMANLWYDFPLGDTGLTPFIGGGIGIANLTLSYEFESLNSFPRYRVNNLGKTTLSTISGSTYTVSPFTTTSTTYKKIDTEFKDDESVFAYQFGAGLGYEFENGLRLSAQYRYFATTEADFGALSDNVETSDVLFSISFPFGRGN